MFDMHSLLRIRKVRSKANSTTRRGATSAARPGRLNRHARKQAFSGTLDGPRHSSFALSIPAPKRVPMVLGLLRAGLRVCTVFSITSCDRTGKQWEAAKQKDTIVAYKDFLHAHPQSQYSLLASNRITHLKMERAWMLISNAPAIPEIRSFQALYPNSTHRQDAIRLLAKMFQKKWNEIRFKLNPDLYSAFNKMHPPKHLLAESAFMSEAMVEAKNQGITNLAVNPCWDVAVGHKGSKSYCAFEIEGPLKFGSVLLPAGVRMTFDANRSSKQKPYLEYGGPFKTNDAVYVIRGEDPKMWNTLTPVAFIKPSQ